MSKATPNLIHLPDFMSDAFGISRSEARRNIMQGGVRIDDEREHRLDVPAPELAGHTLRLGRRRQVEVEELS